MDKKETPEITADILLADILLRITVLEKLLFDKKILDQEEYSKELEAIAIKASNAILKKVENSKNVQEFIASLEEKKSKLEKDKVS